MGGRLAVCPGTFDPITNGHVGIIRRALRLFDRVSVAVTVNDRKEPFFTREERMEMIERCFVGEARLDVVALDGLLAVAARDMGAIALIRGLRAPSDFEYELQMTHMNRHITPDLETVFLAAEADGAYVSSSLVREVAALGGDVSRLVPSHVADSLAERFGGASK